MGNRRSRHDRQAQLSPGAAQSTGGAASAICTAVLGSMTQAMRAQGALSAAAIRTSVVKISSSRTHNGCAFGVEFPCAQAGNVQTVLSRAGISVRQYI